jgi:ribosome-associated translation inhibitor RaiA
MEPPRDADATEVSRITVSGHQVDVGDGLRTYATRQLTGVASKYFGGAEDVARNLLAHRQGRIRLLHPVHSGRGPVLRRLRGEREAPVAFNQALERVAKQLRRRKRALRKDKP